MTRCAIQGVGTMSIGSETPFTEPWAMLETMPIREYVKPKVSRRFGRLSKMIYIAASRALENAGVEDPTTIPIVNATCMGETNASLGLLEQIQKTKGKLISLAFVPNSVHNAPAGYLSIGLKNRSPSVTVSQGWVSSEAALAAAADFIDMAIEDQVLVLSGDEADLGWISRLTDLGAGHLAASLEKEAMQEGAVALVVGRAPGDAPLGSVVAAVERREVSADSIARMLETHHIAVGKKAQVRVRAHTRGGDALVTAAAAAIKRPASAIQVDGPGPGTVQAAAMNAIVHAARDRTADELLLIAEEVDDLAITHWRREG